MGHQDFGELDPSSTNRTPRSTQGQYHLWYNSFSSVTNLRRYLLQLEIEILKHQSASDAYSSVGGLEKQIGEIRDLVEIPLVRPDLFRYFGK